jgi:hypothetical protein
MQGGCRKCVTLVGEAALITPHANNKKGTGKFLMIALSKIILIFILVAFCSSCNTLQTNERHTQDSTLAVQTVETTIPKLATIGDGKFLKKYSKAQVLNKLDHNKDSIIKWTNRDMQEWRHIDSSIVVLNKLELARGDNSYSFEICLLKEREGSLQLIAKGTIDNISDNEESYYLTNTRFDTNTYRISEKEYAVGITGTPTWAHNGSNYYNLGTNLILFRIVKNKIYPAVLLPLEYTHGDRHQENDSTILVDNEVSNSSEVIILDNKTNEYFDLLLKTESTSTNQENVKPVVTSTNTRYKWDNTKYIRVEEK